VRTRPSGRSPLVTVRCRPRAWIVLPPRAARQAKVAFLRGRDPADCRWPVHNRPVLVLACGEAQPTVDVLVLELLIAGARIVRARYADGNVITYDPRERMRHAAR
jgi:hypothetical protein